MKKNIYLISIVLIIILFFLATCSVPSSSIREGNNPDNTVSSSEIINNPNLSDLSVSDGNISPEFSKDITEYFVSVDNNISNIFLTMVCEDVKSEVKIDGNLLSSENKSISVDLGIGDNVFSVEVTAQDKITKKTYTIIVNRLSLNNNYLSYLNISSGKLSPSFSKDIIKYKASVVNEVSKIAVFASGEDKKTTIESRVNGGEWNSIFLEYGYPNYLNLDVGKNVVEVKVTAKDGSIKIYTVCVYRKENNSSGSVHISYQNKENYSLKYTNGDFNNWELIGIDCAVLSGYSSSISFDSNGKVHIIYHENSWEQLKHATNASGVWEVEIIDNTMPCGSAASVAIDNNDVLHVCYRDHTDGDLRYARGSFGAWKLDIIDANTTYGGNTSIAIDENNNINISYCDFKRGLKYAVGTYGKWQTEIVESASNSVRLSSLDVDKENNVHISFISDKGLNYAVGSLNDWKIEGIDSDANYAENTTALIVDSNNIVHIAYINNGYLKYTEGTYNSWTKKIIDSSSKSMGFCSIDIDSNEVLHISYVDKSYDFLKYAKGTLEYWETEIIDRGYGDTSIIVEK